MATLVPKGSKVITFDFAPTNDNGQTRQKGFEDRAKELGLDVPEERFPGLLAEVKKQATAAGRLMSDDEFRQLVKRPAGAA